MRKKQRRSRPSRSKKLGRYKSSIEKYCADQLKQNGIEFDYEETAFELLDKFRFPHGYWKMTSKAKLMSNRTGSVLQPIRYTPDFMGKSGKWVIETKGYLPSHHDFPMRWKLFLRHIVDNGLGYAVFLAKNSQQVDQAIQQILKIERHD